MNQVRVRGHQRAGNHYLATLIELNLFNSSNSERHHDQRGHLLPDQCGSDLDNDDILNVFIHRNFLDTLDSIYRMRKRFGLEGQILDFLERKIGDLYDPERNSCQVEVNWLFKDKEIKKGVSSHFAAFQELTLEQWHNLFVSSWLAQGYRKNVYICCYETLLQPMGRVMIIRALSGLLDRPFKQPVKNVRDRVGYYDKDDDSWKK